MIGDDIDGVSLNARRVEIAASTNCSAAMNAKGHCWISRPDGAIRTFAQCTHMLPNESTKSKVPVADRDPSM